MGRALTPDDFWARVEQSTPSGHAIYKGPGEVTKSGHIRITYGGKKQFAHRLAWQLANGPIPPGAYICHRCIGRPDCVNVKHLYCGSAASNSADRDALGRRNPPTGCAHWSSRWTVQQVRELREARRAGVSVKTLVSEWGISRSSLWSLLSGRTYRDVA